MADSSCPEAVETMRTLGFFFAAVLPEYLEGDVLRLQRIAADAPARPDLATDGGRALFDLIEIEHRRSRG